MTDKATKGLIQLGIVPKDVIIAETKGRVLVADLAIAKHQALLAELGKGGVQVDLINDPDKCCKQIASQYYEVCVVNLLLGGSGPFDYIRKLRTLSKNPEIRIMVLSRQAQKTNIQNSIQAGANDFVVEPFDSDNFRQRVLYHLTPKKVVDASAYEGLALTPQSVPFLETLLEATELLCRAPHGSEHAVFLKILQKIAGQLNSNRTSLIIVELESNSGLVLASSDDPTFRDFPISLHKYPEILHVIHTGSLVLVEDVTRNAMTNQINDTVRSIQIGSLMVFPIRFQVEVMGVLTIRRPQANELPTSDVLRVVQALANAMAAHSNLKAILRRLYKDFSSTSAA